MKTILIILTSLIIASTAWAQAVQTELTFEWTPNIEKDLAGYRLYQSTESGVYTQPHVLTIFPEASTGKIKITDGTYFWVLTAYDNKGNESGYSNEVTYIADNVPPENPKGLIITITIKVNTN